MKIGIDGEVESVIVYGKSCGFNKVKRSFGAEGAAESQIGRPRSITKKSLISRSNTFNDEP